MTRRVLGIAGSSKALYFAIVEGGAVLDVEPQRVEIPEGLRCGANLDSFSLELRRRWAEAKPQAASLLLPNSYDSGTNAAIGRIGAETLLRSIAHGAGVDVELLSRPTARSRLGLGQAGQLEVHLKRMLPTPVGRYWTEGRRHAAFAALACEKGTF